MARQNVPVTIEGLEFKCTHIDDADFGNIAAIYVILCVSSDSKTRVLDVGETGELGDRIRNHDRKDCWETHCENNNIWICVYPMPSAQFSKQDRLDVEAGIRRKYDPPCGDR